MIGLTLCLGNALLAVFFGKELNWDLLNYHFYNGYAVLTGRLDLDVAPAQMQSFLNPLLDVPLYLAIATLPPILVGAAYGFVQGLNGVAVWLIGREMLPLEEERHRSWAAFALAILGGFGAVSISELGGSMADTLVSIPVLFSVAVLVRKQQRLQTSRSSVVIGWAGLAGALSGIAVGLKISSALYTAGFALGCLFLVRAASRRLLTAATFAVTAGAAWVTVSGFWLWQMWSRFGDPLFPYVRFFNARPEFAGLVVSPDTRFLPTSLIRAALYPFVWAIHSDAVSEAHFRDWRFAILYLLLAVLAVRWCLGRRVREPRVSRIPAGATAFLLIGGLVSYALWLVTFGVYRYLAPLEWLVPLAITIVLSALVRPPFRTAVIVSVLLLTTVSTKPANWGRAGWSGNYFGVDVPRLEASPSPMVLIAGLNGLSFLVPYFPRDARFIRLQSNSFFYGMALGGFYGEGRARNHLDEVVKAAIASHKGPLYVLLDGWEDRPPDRSEFSGARDVDAVLWKLRLRIRADSCQPIRAHDLPRPPYAILRRGYVQYHLVPTATLCAVNRGDTALTSPLFQGVAAPIARLYFAYFNRLPAEAELERWFAQSKAGTSLASISEAFANSTEFRSRYGPLTNTQFVTLAYRNLLGRDPDPEGLTYWVGLLNTGALTRPQAMLEFSESPEYAQSFHPDRRG